MAVQGEGEGIDVRPFKRLMEESRRLAAGLREAGLESSAQAALLAPNRPEWMLARFALIQAGGIPVLIDAQVGREALDRILDDSGASWLFSTTDLLEKFSQRDGQPDQRIVFLDAGEDESRSWRRFLGPAQSEAPRNKPDDTAVLFCTSGTSGAAKGVPLSHGNLASNVDALHTVASGGSAIDPQLARKLDGLGWRFADGYGLTETSPVVSFNSPEGRESARWAVRSRAWTCGSPSPSPASRTARSR
jgi:long-subunit acyl-CoA synthetase (AMP-forming)